MAFKAERKRKLLNFSYMLLFTALLSYFSYHIFSGESGLLAMLQMEREVAELQQKADILHAERVKLENKVSSLYSKSLDMDMLDEQARRVLGYAKPNEVIYIFPK